MSVTRLAFPEPAGDSISDRGIFLTYLALLATRTYLFTYSSCVLMLCAMICTII